MQDPIFQFCATPMLIEGIKTANVLKEDKTPLILEDFLPKAGTNRSTGYDLRCASRDGITIKAGCMAKIPLGIRMFAPEGWWMEVRPRSSTFAKMNLHSLYGVIDEDYENELMFLVQYFPDQCKLNYDFDIKINFGDRIAQAIPVKREPMVAQLISEEQFAKLAAERAGQRGLGGFGSTGKI